jgi:acyl-CoA synthetase (AMP-forming)/AMP-acid ligase II
MDFPGFWRSAVHDPDRVAVVDTNGTRHTAGDLLAGANRVVHGPHARGVRACDAIVMALPNGPTVFDLLLAAMQAGWHVTPLNTRLTDSEMAYTSSRTAVRWRSSPTRGIPTRHRELPPMDPDKTRAGRRGDFFTVGDVGYLDAEGYLYLSDRKIDMIISAGANIYPAEIERGPAPAPTCGRRRGVRRAGR